MTAAPANPASVAEPADPGSAQMPLPSAPSEVAAAEEVASPPASKPAHDFLANAGILAKLEFLRTLNKEFHTDHPSFDDLFKTIETEPELLKRFLKFANGGWYSTRVQVDSPYGAFTRFGTEGFYKLALASILSHGIGEVGTRFKLWPHLEGVARVGESVAEQLAPDSVEDIFTAGLLHDAMVAPMERQLPDYLYFLECAMNMDPVVTALENNCHGFDHAQAAGELAAELAFSEHIVEAITHHHNESISAISSGPARTVLSLLLVTKKILWLQRTEKRRGFETATEKALLTEISTALDVSSGRIQSVMTDIVEKLKARS